MVLLNITECRTPLAYLNLKFESEPAKAIEKFSYYNETSGKILLCFFGSSKISMLYVSLPRANIISLRESGIPNFENKEVSVTLAKHTATVLTE